MTAPDSERMSSSSGRVTLGAQEKGVVSMAEGEHVNRGTWTAVLVLVALVAALIFGITVLIGGDWIPGTIIVAATLIGLITQVGTIRRLRREGSAAAPPRHKPAH
jgi:branched-subunit amino acid ABC-type transport system permease component